MQAESRWAPRRRTALPAYVRVEGSSASQLAHVRDSSSTGLRIELPGAGVAQRVPNRFELYIPIENTVLLCEVVWREDSQIGVRFIAPAKPLGVLPKTRRAPVAAKPSLFGGLLGRKRG